MATFNDARLVEQVCWSLRYADFIRGQNRALINNLANGAPPIPEAEARENGVEINTNDLGLTRLAHEARGQLYQAFNKPGQFFTARTDYGPVHKRQERGVTVSREISKLMKRSLWYYECQRSKFALDVLHGIGPSCWEDEDHWCPTPLGIEDVMVPTNTLLTFRNLPFFAIWRGYTAEELRRLTQGPNVDPGWNLDVVERACKWADEQAYRLYGGTPWSIYWSPEKWAERFKENSGGYTSDLVPTIDAWDFYFMDDAKKETGWRRRIIFDAYGGAGAWHGYGTEKRMPDKNLLNDKGLFLYNSGDRVWGSKLGEIIHFQFADLSAVAPFRYHSVRSLGFMLYAVCHLQNRLRCAFSKAVFENLMMYMRVNTLDEAERALKIELVDRGIIDESVHFLAPQERWQPNAQMAEIGLSEYKQVIQDNSASYVANQNYSRDRVEKTKFQVMAEVNAMTSLVSAALAQAYIYQKFEYEEIFRRFCKPNSRDPDVRTFRNRCMMAGVPEKLLNPDAWEIETERVMGAGNKTLEMAIAQQLMQWRAAYPPEGQQAILRQATLAVTDDAAFANLLVPETQGVSDSRHDATLAFGSLMNGGRVVFTPDTNRIELVETLLAELGLAVQQAAQQGGMPTPDRLAGMMNTGAHIKQLIEQIGEDKEAAPRAKRYAEALKELTNQMKAFAQRLQQAMKAQQAQGGQDGEAAKTAAKVQAMQLQAQVKARNTASSHAERTAQRQAQFTLEQQQREQEHQQALAHRAQEAQLEVAATDAKTAAEIKRERARAAAEPAKEE